MPWDARETIAQVSAKFMNYIVFKHVFAVYGAKIELTGACAAWHDVCYDMTGLSFQTREPWSCKKTV